MGKSARDVMSDLAKELDSAKLGELVEAISAAG